MFTYRHIDTLEVVGFSDSDYAGWMDDKKSTSGYFFMIAKGFVSWKSVAQTFTASSTIEAEYVACCEATCHAIWLQKFISALGVIHSISKPVKFFYDNSVDVSFSRNTKRTSRSKHVDVKFYVVRERVVKSLISVEHTPTNSILEDPLTKDLPICVF